MNGMAVLEREMDRMAMDGEDGWGDLGDNMKAAMCYLLYGQAQMRREAGTVAPPVDEPPKMWPFPRASWQPDPYVAKNNLRRAAALCVTEWNRLDDVGQ